jgi:phosphatidylserine decarboxylase
MTFAREAWPFVLPVALVALVLLILQWPKSALAVGVLSLLILTFFRIPSRSFSGPTDTLLAPANGKVTGIVMLDEPLLGPEPVRRITTFLSVFNIHVQRAPMSGAVVASQFTPGKKVAAFRPDAGEVNENHFVVVQSANGDKIGIKQIAGLVARRVVSYLEVGQTIERGELIGVIKFGSRVDLYVPASYEVLVKEGDVLTEGLTPVARVRPSTAESPQ